MDGKGYKAPLASIPLAVEEGPKPMGYETISDADADEPISNFIVGLFFGHNFVLTLFKS